jgi:glucosamine--fructose-6-phosphate aminotransferase (isomerizing)
VVIGRGYDYATAHELALKIKETSYVIAEPYSVADFRHGPQAMIDRGFPVLVIAPRSRVLPQMQELIDLLDERRAEVVAFSDVPEVLGRAKLGVPLPPGVPEWLTPLVSVVPGQLFALALAESRGLDPDRPRGLSKITETR